MKRKVFIIFIILILICSFVIKTTAEDKRLNTKLEKAIEKIMAENDFPCIVSINQIRKRATINLIGAPINPDTEDSIFFVISIFAIGEFLFKQGYTDYTVKVNVLPGYYFITSTVDCVLALSNDNINENLFDHIMWVTPTSIYGRYTR